MVDVQSDSIEDLSQSLAALTPAESRKISLEDEAAQILPLSRHGSESGDSFVGFVVLLLSLALRTKNVLLTIPNLFVGR